MSSLSFLPCANVHINMSRSFSWYSLAVAKLIIHSFVHSFIHSFIHLLRGLILRPPKMTYSEALHAQRRKEKPSDACKSCMQSLWLKEPADLKECYFI